MLIYLPKKNQFCLFQIREDDALPKQLCPQCFEDVTGCYLFVDICQRSEQVLLSILNQQETAIKTESLQAVSDEIKQEVMEESEDQETSFLQKQIRFEEVMIKMEKLDTASHESQEEVAETSDLNLQIPIKIEKLEAVSDGIKQETMEPNDIKESSDPLLCCSDGE